MLARYATLTADDIKILVVADKWLASIHVAIEGEVQRLTQALTGRVQELAKRYAHRLPELEQEVETFTAKVSEQLRKMGVDWV